MAPSLRCTAAPSIRPAACHAHRVGPAVLLCRAAGWADGLVRNERLTGGPELLLLTRKPTAGNESCPTSGSHHVRLRRLGASALMPGPARPTGPALER